jgi:hypothetical protein
VLDSQAWITNGGSPLTAPTFAPTVGSTPHRAEGRLDNVLRSSIAERKWFPTCPVRAPEAPGGVHALIVTVYCPTQGRSGLGSPRNI